MPFLSEELFQRLPRRAGEDIPSVSVAPYPEEVWKNYIVLAELLYCIFGGASAASEATLSSCPLRLAVYVGIVRAINPSGGSYVAAAD